ncbi:MAG: EAL domain-containing protein [Clostridium sp.]|nr:EAL domain-containing protein [Clostridium sp.]
MGIWLKSEAGVDMERRFDRAKLAADTIRNNFNQSVALYDSGMHEKEILAERLIDSVDEALEKKQFLIYYQPKFAIQGERPKLVSAEALIRWKHPEFGMISPGIFIPLFEENGLIQRLDHYVWEEAAMQVRRWREKLGVTVPVSVNVSRIDIYDPLMIDRLKRLIEENEIAPEDYLLEITESAYTEDSRQIVQIVEELREAGFRIEMDDFGSGYSSLNMLSEIPLDVLKLDMRFIRNLRTNAKSLQLMKLIVDIARYLNVPVVAEGLSRCMNNEAFYIRLVKMAAADTSGYDALGEALANNDVKAGFEAAHGLKGMLANLALTPLSQPASELTEILRTARKGRGVQGALRGTH